MCDFFRTFRGHLSLAILFLTTLFSPFSAFADHGSCPCSKASQASVSRHPTVIEPRQRAIILWNGRVERLILSMDVATSFPLEGTGTVAEFIPLPAQPSIGSEQLDVFERMKDVWTARAPDVATLSARQPIGKPSSRLSVKHVSSSDDLIASLSIGCDIDPSFVLPITHIVENYTKRGLQWYAFDSIDADATVQSFPPIVYEFESPTLYYPLETSTMAVGNTSVDLVIISPDGIRDFGATSTPLLVASEFTVSSTELSKVRSDWAEFISTDNAVIQHVQLEGKLSDMQLDLVGR